MGLALGGRPSGSVPGPDPGRDPGLDDPRPSPDTRATALTLRRALGMVVGLVAFLVGAGRLADNSLLTHLATGHLIVDRWAVPTSDPYSSTALGEPWTVQSWLVSVIYELTVRPSGLVGVRLLHGLVAALIGLGIWRLVAPARQVVPRFGLALLPVAVGAGLWSPRPLMFALAAMVGLLAVVGPPSEGGVAAARRDWLLVPLMWLWVNAHGSFPLAIALLGALAVGSWLDDRQFPTTELRRLGIVALGIGLGALNPIGPRLLWFPVELAGRRSALDGVVEWQPPSFGEPHEWLYLGLVPLTVVAAKRGATWRALVPSVCFLASGFLAIRNMAAAAIVIVALLAPMMASRHRATDGGGPGAVARVLGRATVAAAAVAVAAVMVQPAADLSRYPVAEVDRLEEQGLVPSAGGLVHRDGVGNYLTFRYGEGAGVFIDDRFDFYPLAVTEDHLDLLEGGDYEEILDRREANVVLWEADTLLADWLAASDTWRIVSAGDEWVAACRVDSPVVDRCTRR